MKTCLLPPVKLSQISADQHSTLYAMFSSTIPGPFQDLFQACLGFARKLYQRPGLYCRLEGKLRDKFFNFQTGSPGKFPGKRKSPSDYRRNQRRRKPPRKGMPTPGNHRVGSVAPGDLQETERINIFPGIILSSIQSNCTLVKTFILSHKYTTAGQSRKFYL